MRVKILAVIAVLGTTTLLASAQSTERPLTNRDVVDLLKAKVPERVIVSRIRAGPAAFDTSADALIDLHRSGASQEILEAMIAKRTTAPPPPSRQAPPPSRQPEPPSTTPSVAMAPGLAYILYQDERTLLHRGGYLKNSPRPFGSKLKVKFDGPRAASRIYDPMPSFEVAISADLRPSENILLIRPRVEEDEREIEAARFGFTGPHRGRVVTVELQYEQVKQLDSPTGRFSIYRVTPLRPLASGEYVLAVNGGPRYSTRGVHHYDFGLD